MTGLASVQTAADAAPMTWGYVLAALAFTAAFAAFLLLPAYLDSTHHRRAVARRRAHRRMPMKGAAPHVRIR